MLPIPVSIGGSPSFLLVRRGTGTEAGVCSVAVVGCEADGMAYGHRGTAARTEPSGRPEPAAAADPSRSLGWGVVGTQVPRPRPSPHNITKIMSIRVC